MSQFRYFLYIFILFLISLLFGCDGVNTTVDVSDTQLETTVITTETLTTEIAITTAIETTEEMTTGIVITTEDDVIIFSLNPGVDTIEVYDTFIDAGAVASLNDVSMIVTTVLNTVDEEEVGIYYIQYTIEYNEVEFSLYRVVFVIDSTKPVMTLNPGIDTIHQGNEWIDAGVVASDNYDDELLIEVMGDVDIDTIGDYYITYIATDDSGNSATILRVVHVIE